jgi:hypothetical protein
VPEPLLPRAELVNAPVRLAAEDLELLADLVAERVLDRMGAAPASDAPPALIDAAEVARRLSKTPAWVREHADELGVIRLGDGPRPRLAFDPDRVAAALGSDDRLHREQAPRAPDVPAQPAVRRRRRRTANGHHPDLLPIRGTRAL